MLRLLCAGLALIFLTSQAIATERTKQGMGLMLTNDSFGDSQDRWRTGSLESSWIFAPDWEGQAPARFGELMELRINGEIVSPENLNRPAANDRRYGQALSIGLHIHFQPRSIEYAVGVDAYITGPQVGLDGLQEDLHDIFGGRELSPAVRAGQVSDDVYASVVVEAGRTYEIGGSARLRPFVELRGGVETLARVGADLTIGNFGKGGLLVRTPTTGHRLSAVEETPYQGFSFLLGADVAYVDNSIWLADTGPSRLNHTRTRARAGLHWRSEAGTSIFYGATWPDKEFKSQRDSQIVGALQLRIKF